MKKILFFIVAVLCLKMSVYAVLPPLYNSVDEIKAILVDKRLGKALDVAEPILEIIRTHKGYAVITPRCLLNIDLEYIPTTRVGPAKFKLNFHDPIQREFVDKKM